MYTIKYHLAYWKKKKNFTVNITQSTWKISWHALVPSSWWNICVKSLSNILFFIKTRFLKTIHLNAHDKITRHKFCCTERTSYLFLYTYIHSSTSHIVSRVRVYVCNVSYMFMMVTMHKTPNDFLFEFREKNVYAVKALKFDTWAITHIIL